MCGVERLGFVANRCLQRLHQRLRDDCSLDDAQALLDQWLFAADPPSVPPGTWRDRQIRIEVPASTYPRLKTSATQLKYSGLHGSGEVAAFLRIRALSPLGPIGEATLRTLKERINALRHARLEGGTHLELLRALEDELSGCGGVFA
jgi:hypothetical protein